MLGRLVVDQYSLGSKHLLAILALVLCVFITMIVSDVASVG